MAVSITGGIIKVRQNRPATVPAVIVALALVLQGCVTPLVRDQAQVDPVVASVFGATGSEQPIPIIPDCTVRQWVERAVDGASMRCSGSDHSVAFSGNSQSRQFESLAALATTDATQRRSQVQAELMTYGDLVCDRHLAGIYASNAGLNFLGGLGTTLLSGAAAIASGRSATNLAAGSALFSGTRSLMNSEIYYGYIGPAVITELRALRADLRMQIGSKRTCALSSYPPQEAINDALMYHDACSFATGLASLLNKAGVTRVGEDKLRTGQIAVINQQLTTKKADLLALQTVIDADPGTDNTAAAIKKRSDLLQRKNELEARIAEQESIQRFAGVVDPNMGAAAQPLPRNSVESLQMAVVELEKAAPAHTDLPKLKSQLATAIANMGEVAALELQIRDMQSQLYQDRKKLASINASTDAAAFAAAQKVVDQTVGTLGGLYGRLVAAGGSAQSGSGALTSTGQDCTKPVAQAGTSR